MNVLITGGAGFVGRRFARRLLDNDFEVTVVDNLVAGQYPEQWAFQPKSRAKLTFVENDCREYFKLHVAHEFDLIIHCAAIVGGRLKIDGDPLAVATDLSIDAEFFNWAVRLQPAPKVIYFSSSAVYPTELQTRQCHCALSEALVNFDTRRISMPDMSYGWAKLSGEYLAKFAAEHYGLDVAIYRPFGGYGEDQSFDYPFPSIIKRILDNEDPIVVWGSGDQQRDFIYIEDIVDAVLQTQGLLRSAEPLNLGTGIGISFRELADIARDVLQTGGSITNDASKPEGVFSRVADTAKLFEMYKPTTTLTDGIRRVAAYMRA